jgi:glucose-1-phosphate thymidylyltransferase
MWGIVPAAGQGSRMQPLAFSKELLPVGSRRDGDRDRPRAVSEYLVERLVLGGADKICFVISPGKSDILEYYGGGVFSASVFYSVQPHASGLCDAIFRALPLIADDEQVLVGLPDTIWFPEGGLRALPDDELSFLLFPVARPELFDAVVLEGDRVLEIQVKRPDARSRWIWGAFKMPGRTLRDLHGLWLARGQSDEYVGTLINAWMREGGAARGVCAGEGYVDVGTVQGYREAIALLSGGDAVAAPAAGGAGANADGIRR